MLRRRSLRPFGRLGVVLAAFAAALLHAWTPAGFMPDPGRPGALVICTGHGPVAVSPSRRPDRPPAHATSVCAFAAASAPCTAPPPPPTAVVARLNPATPPSASPASPRAPPRACPHPPSTGPPAPV